ncbi:MAG: hypothetical protein CL878_11750, partial [Dehalococcoidia bacterium]|nr:hypothetical protein [Dehalococcoidia bacterium]
QVEDGRIVAVGPAAQLLPPADPAIPQVEYGGATLLPGLIDAHVHLTLRRRLSAPRPPASVTEGHALLYGVQAARNVLASGVTTVRDCAARGQHAQELRDAVEEGTIVGPRILASGPPVTTTAGHIWRMGYEADSVTEMRRAVRRLVKEGVDFIKVCATGGRGTPGSVVGRAQYSTDELRAVAEDAHRLERHVATHALGTEGIRRAVEAGIDTIEHCAWLDRDGKTLAFDEAVAERMAEQGLVASIAAGPPWEVFHQDKELAGNGSPPTTVAWLDTMRQRWQLVHRMRDFGVTVCFGTDSVYGMFGDFHDLSYLAQAFVEYGGFAPLDVIEMVTAVPAHAIGWGDRIGTVEPGKLADLLVIHGNPIEDMRALHDVAAVYQAGRLVVQK